MRAGHLKENVAALRTLGPVLEARVRTRQHTNIMQIERATRMEWLDARLDVALTEAIAVEAGFHAVRQLNSEAISKTIEGPLLKPLVEGALKLFGFTPTSLLPWTGHAYGQIYRDCGAISVGSNRTAVTINQVPGFMCDSTAWLEGIAGALEGTVRICRGIPRVSYVVSATDPGRVDFTVHVASAAELLSRV